MRRDRVRDPEALRDLVASRFERLVPAIERYGGTVEAALRVAEAALQADGGSRDNRNRIATAQKYY